MSKMSSSDKNAEHQRLILEGLKECIHEIRPDWDMYIESAYPVCFTLVVGLKKTYKGRIYKAIYLQGTKVCKRNSCFHDLADPDVAGKIVAMLEYCAKPQAYFPCFTCPGFKGPKNERKS